MPDKSSPWAEEGTQAHEVLESLLSAAIDFRQDPTNIRFADGTIADRYMWIQGRGARDFIINLWAKNPRSDIQVETRIYLDFIHPEMFGTFDAAVVDHFGTLHVFDYKYGAGTFVSPVDNLQMIFYGIGLAHLHHWNFKKIRLWIIQPRVKGYDGPLFWDLSIQEAVAWAELFRLKVKDVERNPDTYVEGSWCHFCRAKSICPLKRKAKTEAACMIFGGDVG